MTSIRQGATQLVVGADDDGRRLDNFLATRLGDLPRSRRYAMVRSGEVRVNGGRARPSQRLTAGDRVRLPPLHRGAPPPAETVPERLAALLRSAILHEDAELLVVNKPAGLAVHGGSGVRHSVIGALRALRPDDGRIELVHRLDRDTSGCLLIARSTAALRRLHEALRNGALDKRYLLWVHGAWPSGLGSIDEVLDASGAARRARSDFRVLERRDGATLLEARLHTGRTHQLRRQCQQAGHPIIGDRRYGDWRRDRALLAGATRRLYLHAVSVAWPRPDGGRRRVRAPLPEAFADLAGRLGGRLVT